MTWELGQLDVRKPNQNAADVIVEVSPSNFLNPHTQARISPGFQSAFITHLLAFVQGHPTAYDSAGEIWTQPR